VATVPFLMIRSYEDMGTGLSGDSVVGEIAIPSIQRGNKSRA